MFFTKMMLPLAAAGFQPRSFGKKRCKKPTCHQAFFEELKTEFLLQQELQTKKLNFPKVEENVKNVLPPAFETRKNPRHRPMVSSDPPHRRLFIIAPPRRRTGPLPAWQMGCSRRMGGIRYTMKASKNDLQQGGCMKPTQAKQQKTVVRKHQDG